MQFPDLPSPLIVMVGPTAVGKTGLSIRLAERIGGEIVSADSRLFYRGMDIGTAKPTLTERNGIPHHLIDVADPDEPWSLSLFQKSARQVIAEIHQRHRLPILVGGTGQYVHAITEAWDIPVQRPDPALRDALMAWESQVGKEGLYQRLEIIDPEAAGHIDLRNVRRTVRALEVILRTGRRFSEQRKKGSVPYSIIQIGLTRPRSELYQRIDARIDGMIASGLVQEVRDLLAKGYSRDLPTLSAIGYREVIAYLEGEITLEEAVTLIKRASRQFVRRQANWFKGNDPNIFWFQMNNNTLQAVEVCILNKYNWRLPILKDEDESKALA
ncbi:MAG TPA: tRNA (adenosine(37)-N6)-dimethylallyltransferase MiaA [Longilinea sp.]|nr:tRNA (adenosine(37)-N6)-dimethylallyltransferase MiaA [Longilinea sp.]